MVRRLLSARLPHVGFSGSGGGRGVGSTDDIQDGPSSVAVCVSGDVSGDCGGSFGPGTQRHRGHPPSPHGGANANTQGTGGFVNSFVASPTSVSSLPPPTMPAGYGLPSQHSLPTPGSLPVALETTLSVSNSISGSTAATRNTTSVISTSTTSFEHSSLTTSISSKLAMTSNPVTSITATPPIFTPLSPTDSAGTSTPTSTNWHSTPAASSRQAPLAAIVPVAIFTILALTTVIAGYLFAYSKNKQFRVNPSASRRLKRSFSSTTMVPLRDSTQDLELALEPSIARPQSTFRPHHHHSASFSLDMQGLGPLNSNPVWSPGVYIPPIAELPDEMSMTEDVTYRRFSWESSLYGGDRIRRATLMRGEDGVIGLRYL